MTSLQRDKCRTKVLMPRDNCYFRGEISSPMQDTAPADLPRSAVLLSLWALIISFFRKTGLQERNPLSDTRYAQILFLLTFIISQRLPIQTSNRHWCNYEPLIPRNHQFSTISSLKHWRTCGADRPSAFILFLPRSQILQKISPSLKYDAPVRKKIIMIHSQETFCAGSKSVVTTR